MGSLADKIQHAIACKNAIKQALINKGLSPSNVFSTYAGEIDSLLVNLCGSLTFGGSYASATYFTESGCRMGFNTNGEVIVVIQGGTSTSYENVIFTLASAPSGITLETGGTTFDTGDPAGNYFVGILKGVTKKINVSVNFAAVNATYDWVEARLTVTYA